MGWVRCIMGRCLLGAGDPRRGHIHGVTALRWASNGILYSGDSAGEVRRWDVTRGQTTGRWRAHKGPIRALALTHRGWLLTAGEDEVIRLWWPARKLLIGLWKVRGTISDLALSSGDRWLAAASTDRAIWLRRLALPKPGAWPSPLRDKGRWRRLLGHQDAVRSVAFAQAGKLLLSGSDDRTLRLWSLPSGRAKVLRGHRGWVRRAIFGRGPSKDGPWLLSASFDTTLLRWSISGVLLERWGTPVDPFTPTTSSAKLPPRLRPKYRSLRAQKNPHKSDISDIDVSPDGHWILSTGHRSALLQLPDDGTTARLWDRQRKTVVCHLKGHQLGLTRGQFAPNGRRFATASEDGTIRIYELMVR